MINGVFLVALCLSIVLDAIQRFYEPQEVKNPVVVGGVGTLGLVFNILGLFVFHQHSHSHGEEDGEEHDHDHDHDHGHSHDQLNDAENGHAHKHDHGKDQRISWDASAQDRSATTKKIRHGSVSSKKSQKSRRNSRSYSTIDDLPIHPASLREGILAAARQGPEVEADDEAVDEYRDQAPADENTSLLGGSKNGHAHAHTHSHSPHSHKHHHSSDGLDHSEHNHAQPRQPAASGHGHSHADMNLRGMFLHVLGDALGNVGVIAAAAIIYYFPMDIYWPTRYVDPAISLVITLIILSSALPLCRDTAKPLLQAVPGHISVEEIAADIETLPGVKSCHHVHVWALTPSKLVATLDVEVDFSIGTEINASGHEKWMALAKEIKACLHGFGIHSSTIQPEFAVNADAASLTIRASSHGGDGAADACFLDCKGGCKTGKQCCDAPRSSKGASGDSSPTERY